METGKYDLKRRNKSEVVGYVEVLETKYNDDIQWKENLGLIHLGVLDLHAELGTVTYKVYAKGCKEDVRQATLIGWKKYKNDKLVTDWEYFETYNSRYSLIHQENKINGETK